MRQEAEWLLALQSQLTPGQKLLEVDLGEGEPLRIALDPALSPVEQAQRKFKRAGKMVRAAQFVPERRARLTADLAFLDQLGSELARTYQYVRRGTDEVAQRVRIGCFARRFVRGERHGRRTFRTGIRHGQHHPHERDQAQGGP